MPHYLKNRVVAAARSQEGLERCLELGADAAVRLGQPDDLSAALADAAEGRIDVVVDPLLGEPFVAAVNAASFGARIVQVGAGAGAEATVPSAAIRGKMLEIMGHTNFAAPPEVKREVCGPRWVSMYRPNVMIAPPMIGSAL